jgi:hypothetical protein
VKLPIAKVISGQRDGKKHSFSPVINNASQSTKLQTGREIEDNSLQSNNSSAMAESEDAIPPPVEME